MMNSEYVDDDDDELDALLAGDERLFTIADVALAMRRGVRMGFDCGCDVLMDVADDDMQRREVVERPLVMRRLRACRDRWTEFVDEEYED